MARHNERRQYVRTTGALRFTMERLDTSLQQEEALWEIASEPGEKPLETVPVSAHPVEAHLIRTTAAILETLADMNHKIDLLLAHAEGRELPVRELLRLPLHNISGGGFSFNSDHAIKVGERYRVTIELAHMPLQTVRCIARVQRVEPVEQRDSRTECLNRIGMKIEHIMEADRERIIQKVFQLQREDLRSRREKGKD